jgi:hypothetical protein
MTDPDPTSRARRGSAAPGGARAARIAVPQQGALDPLRVRHLALASRVLADAEGPARVLVDERESPLAWLARRRGKGGEALVGAHHLQAGERLRADFTCAQLMPRTTSNWDVSAARGRRAAGPAMTATESALAARQRLHHALDAAGPEFSGLLLDVCCFLKGLEDVERERLWPRGAARIVLRLGLDCLARHYGYAAQAVGRARAPLRSWSADEAPPAG